MSDPEITIRLLPNGPARVEAARCRIVKADGTVIEKEGSFSLCRCGVSKSKPYCDGSHNLARFRD